MDKSNVCRCWEMIGLFLCILCCWRHFCLRSVSPHPHLFCLAFCQRHFVFIFFFFSWFPFLLGLFRIDYSYVTYMNSLSRFSQRTRSLFVTNMPRHSQSGRRTSLGIRVGFIESYVVFTICLCIYLCLSSGVPRNFVRGKGFNKFSWQRTERTGIWGR